MARLSEFMPLIELAIQAFGKRRKVRRLLEELQGAGAHYADFLVARDQIDRCAALGEGVNLSAAEVAALDFVMDRFAKAAEKVKRKIG